MLDMECIVVPHSHFIKMGFQQLDTFAGSLRSFSIIEFQCVHYQS